MAGNIKGAWKWKAAQIWDFDNFNGYKKKGEWNNRFYYIIIFMINNIFFIKYKFL